jgi:S1-C subfamily serine protease
MTFDDPVFEDPTPAPPPPPAPARRPGSRGLFVVIALLVVGLVALGGAAVSLYDRVTALEAEVAAIPPWVETAGEPAPVRTVPPSTKGDVSLYDEPADLQAFIDEVSESIVTVFCGESNGTGFAIDLTGLDEGYESFIVTNHHVIDECIDDPSALTVTYGGEEEIETDAELFGWDEENDLALIEIGRWQSAIRARTAWFCTMRRRSVGSSRSRTVTSTTPRPSSTPGTRVDHSSTRAAR